MTAHNAETVRPIRMQFTQGELVVLAYVVSVCRGNRLIFWPDELAVLESLHEGFGMMVQQGARLDGKQPSPEILGSDDEFNRPPAQSDVPRR